MKIVTKTRMVPEGTLSGEIIAHAGSVSIQIVLCLGRQMTGEEVDLVLTEVKGLWKRVCKEM